MELIRHGDPKSFALTFRRRLLERFSEAEAAGDVSSVSADHQAIWAFSEPELADTILAAWIRNEGWANRSLLLAMIQQGQISECADLVADEAQPVRAPGGLTRSAISCLGALGQKASLKKVAQALIQGEYGWESSRIVPIAKALYPSVLSTEELLILMSQTRRPKAFTTAGFEYCLDDLYLDCPAKDRTVFLSGVAGLALAEPHAESCQKVSNRHGYLAKGFGRLALAAIREGCDQDALVGVVLALSRVHESITSRDGHERLFDVVKQAPELRQKLILAAIQTQVAGEDPETFERHPWMGTVITQGMLVWSFAEPDIEWLISVAESAGANRNLGLAAFYAALDISESFDCFKHYEPRFVECAEGKPVWQQWLNHKRQGRKKQAWQIAWERRNAKHEQKRRREKGRTLIGWGRLVRELGAGMPDPDFSNGLTPRQRWAMGSLTHWLKIETGTDHHAAPRSWRKLEPLFGSVIAQGYAALFDGIWRQVPPRRPRWSGNTCSTSWTTIYAFAGVGVTADGDPDWAANLSPHEARQAIRHMLYAGEDAPDWIGALLRHHGETLVPLFRNEVKREWRQGQNHPAWISWLAYSTEALDRRLADAAFSVFMRHEPGKPDLWEKAIRFLERLELDHLQWQNLLSLSRRWIGNPEAGLEYRLRFLALLCLNDIDAALPEIEKAIAANGGQDAQYVIGTLFDGHHGGLAPQSLGSATAETLERLLILAYQHVRIEDDIHRLDDSPDDEEEGRTVRSVGRRDYAEGARNAILSALLNHPSAAAYEAVRRLASNSDPAFRTHLFNGFSKRMVEQGASHSPWSERDFSEFQRLHVLPIKTHAQFFEFVMSLMKDIQSDFSTEDATSRPLLRIAEKESEVQDWLFEHLKLRSGGRLSRILEAQVKGKKRPDLIVASTSLDSQIAIEVKHGDKGWTIPDLEHALSNQLVGQYLKPAHRRGGILFVTRHQKRWWKEPESGKRVGFDDAVRHLQDHAGRISSRHPVFIHLAVVGLDLREKN